MTKYHVTCRECGKPIEGMGHDRSLYFDWDSGKFYGYHPATETPMLCRDCFEQRINDIVMSGVVDDWVKGRLEDAKS